MDFILQSFLHDATLKMLMRYNEAIDVPHLWWRVPHHFQAVRQSFASLKRTKVRKFFYKREIFYLCVIKIWGEIYNGCQGKAKPEYKH